jgi:uncharacterized protein YwgA
MDRQQIGLKLAWDALGLPMKLGTFGARLTLQKAIYLAQEAGVQLGYSFRWYLRGPYSPDLTRDAFAVTAALSQGTGETQGWRLDDVSQQRIPELRQHFAGITAAHLPRKLELLASVHFLRKTSTGWGKSSVELAGVLKGFGKHYTSEQVQQAIEELAHYGLALP